MSHTTKRRLNKFADVLEAVATTIINAVELVMIDLVFGKSKYRKHEYHRGGWPQSRVVHERVIIRPSAPRVYVVKPKQEQ